MLVTEPGDVHGAEDVLATAQRVLLTGRCTMGSRVTPGNWGTEWECCCRSEENGLGVRRETESPQCKGSEAYGCLKLRPRFGGF